MNKRQVNKAVKYEPSAHIKQWHANLRNVVRRLKALYKKNGTKNPDKMPAYKLTKEYDLLSQIHFTTFMPKAWASRWQAIKRAHDSLVVCSYSSQF